MNEILRTTDVVLVGAVEALLASASIPSFVADAHVSAVEGAIGLFPRRLLVPAAHAARARALLVDAGFGPELRDER